MIRPAEEKDLPTLIGMAERFVSESELPYTFNASLTTWTFRTAISDPSSILLVEEVDDALGGGIMGTVSRDFCNEYAAYITKMYVEREFRGLGTSRDLIAGFHDAAKLLGASLVFAAATAGMGERVEKLFVHLFVKQGYRTLGRVLVREI